MGFLLTVFSYIQREREKGLLAVKNKKIIENILTLLISNKD